MLQEKFKQFREDIDASFDSVIEKLHQDPKLKDEFIASPINVFNRLTGKSLVLPEGFSLRIIDNTDPKILNLRIPPNMDDVELDDEELEMVAGGYASNTTTGCTTTNNCNC